MIGASRSFILSSALLLQNVVSELSVFCADGEGNNNYVSWD